MKDRDVSTRSSKKIDRVSPSRERRDQYEQFFLLAEDGILVYQAGKPEEGGHFTDANPAICRLLGRSREELLKLSPVDIVLPEEGKLIPEEIRLLRHQDVLRHEKTFVAKDGRQIPVEIVSRRFEQDGELMIMSTIRDITERRQREQERKENSRRLRNLQKKMARAARIPEESPNPILQISKEGKVLWMNQAAKQFCQSICRMKVDKTVCPQLLELGLKAMRAWKVLHSEFSCGGRLLWVVSKPVNGYANLYCHDVTDRQQAEAALRESETRFRDAFAEAPVGMVMVGLDGTFLDVNPAYCRLVGYAPEELVGTGMTFGDLTHPEDLTVNRVQIQRLIAGEIPAMFYEKRYVHKNGEIVWVRASVTARRDAAGQPFQLVAVVEDITRRKQAEENLRESEAKYRAVFEQAAIGMGRVRFEDARWIDVNDTFCGMLGYSREEMLSTPWPQITHPEDVDADLVPFGRMAAGDLDSYSLEKRFVHKEGHHVWAKLTLSLVRDAQGRPQYEIAVIEDITRRKETEQSLHELNETLEQRVIERTEQLRGLALQLSQAEQLERKRLAKILHDHLQQLIVAARMQLGWMETGENVAEMQAAAREVGLILQEAVDASRSLAVDLSPPVLHEAGLGGGLNWLASDVEKKHQFHVDVQVEKGAEPGFEEMRILLFESVRELLLNAVKHSGVSAAQVTVMRADDGEILLIVSDQGRGFDPEVLRRRRSDEVSFGLFSIQERLAHIGGRMIVESAPGKGTRVTLAVPGGGAVQTAEAVAGAAKVEGPAETVTLQRKSELCSVLIVDDHKIMRQGLAKLFRLEPDIEVVGEAADGPEAIALAEALEPDVVIMDVNLGEMSGVEATRRVLERRPEVKVIGLSMHLDKAVADAMLEAGACAYLTKSGPSEELVEAVRRIREAKAAG